MLLLLPLLLQLRLLLVADPSTDAGCWKLDLR
jgi:hypothetical protein